MAARLEPAGTAAATPRRAARTGPAAAWLTPTLSLLGLVLLWQAAAWLAADPRTLPPPWAVALRLVAETRSGDLPYHLGITLLRVAASFVLAMSVGTGLGLVMGRVRPVDAALRPWLVFFLNLPALVTIILAYIWIGLNETAAIVAVALNKIPTVAVTVREGARALDPGLGEMATVFRLDRRRVLLHLVAPQLAPYLLATARSGLALVWKIVLVVELLGRSNGVGFQLGIFFQLFDVASILAYALSFIAIVQLIEWLLLQPLERRLGRWRR